MTHSSDDCTSGSPLGPEDKRIAVCHGSSISAH
jgi:hypothetical protein